MLTDYFSCYKLNKKPPPLSTKRKNSPKLKICQIFNITKFLDIQTLVFINFNTKKVIFISFLHLHSGKKLPLIILVYRLHSIFTYVGCHSSIKCNLPHQFLPLLVIIAIRIPIFKQHYIILPPFHTC